MAGEERRELTWEREMAEEETAGKRTTEKAEARGDRVLLLLLLVVVVLVLEEEEDDCNCCNCCN